VDESVAAAMRERTMFEIYERPTLLEYLSFMLFFPNLLAGPAFEYREYIDYMHGRLYDPKARIPCL
jgi:D-alanyl-lipoteichoic acid acyltransferase DltB (MBOAT superfamily)